MAQEIDKLNAEQLFNLQRKLNFLEPQEKNRKENYLHFDIYTFNER